MLLNFIQKQPLLAFIACFGGKIVETMSVINPVLQGVAYGVSIFVGLFTIKMYLDKWKKNSRFQ